MKLSEEKESGDKSGQLDEPPRKIRKIIHRKASRSTQDCRRLGRRLITPNESEEGQNESEEEQKHPAERIYDLIESSAANEEGVTKQAIKKILHCKSSQF